MSKSIKITVDICMVLLLVFCLIGLQTGLWWHVILGYVLVPATAFHVLLNRKWLIVSLRAIIKGKANSKTLYMMLLVVVLTVSFIVVIVSGFILTQISPISDDIFSRISNHFNSQYSWYSDLHVGSSVVFIISIALHVKVHWSYIKSKLDGKKKSQNQ